MTKQELEKRAEQILRENDIYRVPIAIETLAYKLKLSTHAAALGDRMSGVLMVENGRGAIGYNSDHPHVRQRFTIAHEIAHYILHVKQSQQSQLFIDKYVAFRSDTGSNRGNDRNEVEANRLGAALLMPESLVRKQIIEQQLDLDDEDAVSFLAKQFQVSTVAMTNRLINLSLLR